MANTQQVLALLEKGLNPQQIAKKLKCSDAYVRATRQRATPDGREKSNAWKRDHYKRIRSSAKGCAALRAYRRGERAFPKAGLDYPANR